MIKIKPSIRLGAKPKQQKIQSPAPAPVASKTQKRTDLIVIDETRLPAVTTKKTKLSKKEEKSLNSIFGESSESIIEFVDMNDNDGAQSLIYKALMKTMIKVITLAEHNVHETEGARGIYGFNQLVSQMRELLVDLQSQQDKGAMIEQILSRILIPAFTDIGMQVNYSMTHAANICRPSLSDSEFARLQQELNTATRALGQFISDRYRSSVEEVHKSFT